ncbi:MAG: hypothetical protein HUU18_00795 [Phycisphaerales bacterium]|nr:hypothetical protein [Phycisphaerales bacterium]
MQGISSVASGSGTSSGGFSALSSEDFAKIIFTELSKQDPLQPNDTNALLEQISMIRSIEADQNLSDRLGSLVGQNEFSNAATLIGRRIEGLNEINLRVSGVVRSVARTNQGPVLTLTDGSRVAMSRIDGVHEIREGT